MDLWERDLARARPTFCWRVICRSAGRTSSTGSPPCRFFMSLRAAIRAKVEAANLAHLAGGARRAERALARRYFVLAEAFLRPAAAASRRDRRPFGNGKERARRRARAGARTGAGRADAAQRRRTQAPVRRRRDRAPAARRLRPRRDRGDLRAPHRQGAARARRRPGRHSRCGLRQVIRAPGRGAARRRTRRSLHRSLARSAAGDAPRTDRPAQRRRLRRRRRRSPRASRPKRSPSPAG